MFKLNILCGLCGLAISAFLSSSLVHSQEPQTTSGTNPIFDTACLPDADIPKTKGATLIVEMRPEPIKLQQSSAKNCEEERCRLSKLKLISVCIYNR